MARIDPILKLAMEQGASDLHLAAGAPPLARVHGEITPVPHDVLSRDLLQLVLFEVMDPALKARFEQARDVDFAYEVPGVTRVRCHVYEQARGLSAAFRLLPAQVPTLGQLGLPERLAGLLDAPRGLIVVTGPPGSGRSSTLAALVDHVNRTRCRHVLTIEDPVEFRHANQRSLVTQREVGRHTPGFAQALRGALREDPDMILVGELPDPETTSLAVTAAATGRLVLAALHTPGAAQAVDHVLDSLPDGGRTQARLLLADSLRAVLAQRLLRRADGAGRTLALEILVGTPAVASLIRDRKTFQLPAVLQAGGDQGMQTLEDSVRGLLRAGLVTPEDAAPHLAAREPLDGPSAEAAAA